MKYTKLILVILLFFSQLRAQIVPTGASKSELHINDLPAEIMWLIFEYAAPCKRMCLEKKLLVLLQFSQVCMHWKEVLHEFVLNVPRMINFLSTTNDQTLEMSLEDGREEKPALYLFDHINRCRTTCSLTGFTVSLIQATPQDLKYVHPLTRDSALHYACMIGSSGFVKLLLAAGADVNTCNEEGLTSIDRAVNKSQSGNMQVLKEILHGHPSNDQIAQALFNACQNKKFEAIIILLNNLKDPKAIFYRIDETLGCTMLHFVCQCPEKSFGKVISTMLALGADPNVQDKLGCTPLHHAVAMGSYDAVWALVTTGASVSIKNCKNKVPVECVGGKSKNQKIRLLQSREL